MQLEECNETNRFLSAFNDGISLLLTKLVSPQEFKKMLSSVQDRSDAEVV